MLAHDRRLQSEIKKSLVEKIIVVYAGTLEPYQGIEILLQAFKYVVKEEHDAFLLIVGGTKEQVEYYSNLAERYDLGEYCTFTGRVSQSLAKYYANNAHVQVSPRISGTNTPLKVYQQLASGIPLVATNIYSHTQVLDEEVAFLVEPEPRDMASGILAALREKVDSKRRTTNAQRLYEQRYSRKVYKDKMRCLLQYLTS